MCGRSGRDGAWKAVSRGRRFRGKGAPALMAAPSAASEWKSDTELLPEFGGGGIESAQNRVHDRPWKASRNFVFHVPDDPGSLRDEFAYYGW